MTDDLDPKLESLFDAAEEAFSDEDFTRRITTQIERRQRRLLVSRLGLFAAIILVEVLLQSPLQQSLGAVAELLGRPLFPIEGEWVEFALAPINTGAGVIGGVLLAVHLFVRKLLH